MGCGVSLDQPDWAGEIAGDVKTIYDDVMQILGEERWWGIVVPDSFNINHFQKLPGS